MANKKYTDKHIEYIKSISKERYNDEIRDMFNSKFDMNVTTLAINSLKSKYNIRSNVKKAKRHYTGKEIKYLKEIAEGRENRELAKMMNEKFGTDRTFSSVMAAKHRSGIVSFPDAPKPYTDEQIEYIKNISSEKSNAEITKAFNEKFNDNRTEIAISSLRFKKGILTGSDGRFEKGDFSPNRVEIGSERITKDDYIQVKIQDGTLQSNWRGKHILIWEKINGPLPEGHAIIFGDGDNRNFDIDNLICVSRKQLLGLNTHDLIQDDAELTRTAVNIVDLNYKISEVKE